VDDHLNSSHPMAARLFRAEYQFQLPENGQLDSRPDRYRDHTHYIETPWIDKLLALPARCFALETCG
jgi:hypothetical protein